MLHVSCYSLPKEVEESLEEAGNNKSEPEKVLNHYKGKNREKYKAACFLIANMKYHHSDGIIIPPDEYRLFFLRTDSLYHQLFSGMTAKEIISYKSKDHDALRKKLSVEFADLPSAFQEHKSASDVTSMKADYLIDNIDFAFEFWDAGKYKNTFDFETFLDCVLPYRTTNEHVVYKRSEINELFGNRILGDASSDIVDRIEQYKAYVEKCRWLNYFTQQTSHSGIYDPFLPKFRNDCHNISTWTSNIFRSCGIPVVYEYTPQWQDKENKHFWCAVPDSAGIFSPFTPPDNNIKEDWDSYIKYAGKVYRKTFKANEETPYFLCNEYEHIPVELSSPVLSDQTFRYHQTITLRLPFEAPTENNLAYLCFFGREKKNLNPVAWGKIDHDKKIVVFEQVPLNVLFFPAYTEGEELVSFGNPFIVKSDGVIDYIPRPFTTNTPDKNQVCDFSVKNNRLYHTREPKSEVKSIFFIPIVGNDDETIELTVTRKYPPKRNLLANYSRLIGSYILGGNAEKGDYDTLCTVNQLLEPYLQEIALDNKKKYRYYKFATWDQGPVNIAHIEFLSPDAHNGNNMPTPLPIFSDRENVREYNGLYKLNGLPLNTGSNPAAAFDGNMETYAGSPQIGMDFGRPVSVTHIRLAPRNANNGITIGDEYELLFFAGRWVSHEIMTAEYNHLQFENVPSKTIYWLRNLTRGNEELPFFYYGGKQHFINIDAADIDKEFINPIIH